MRPLAKRLRGMRADDSGVTVLELVVAASILLVAAIGVVAAMTFAGTSSAQTALRARALNLANQTLEKARNLPYDSVGVTYANGATGDPPGSILATQTFGSLYVETEVSWARDPFTGRSKYKNVKVVVTWSSPRPGRVSLASAIYGTSLLANSGDLNVTVKEKDTGVPITMAQVEVTPNGSISQRVVWTDTTGESFFGALPIGATRVRVSGGTSWVFDDSGVSTASVVPDLVTSVFIYGYRPCTAAVTVVDTSGTPIPSATVNLTDTKGRIKTALTGADGVALFAALVPDTYDVAATLTGRTPGYGSTGAMVGGGAYAVTITLTPAVPPGSLRVRVTGGGAALRSASVAVAGPSPAVDQIAGSPKTTPTSGEVVFTGVASGTYAVTVSRTGYVTKTVSVTVASGVEKVLDIDLSASGSSTGSLQITVVDSRGSPISNAAITVSGPNGYYYSGSVGYTGSRTLTGLAPGDYTVNAVGGETKTVQVTGGTTSVVQVAR